MLSALTERLVRCSRCYPERLSVLVPDENDCGALGVNLRDLVLLAWDKKT